MVKIKDRFARTLPMILQDGVTLADGSNSSVLVDVLKADEIYSRSVETVMGHGEVFVNGRWVPLKKNLEGKTRYVEAKQHVRSVEGLSDPIVNAVVHLKDHHYDILRMNSDSISLGRDYRRTIGLLQESGVVRPFEHVKGLGAEDTADVMGHLAIENAIVGAIALKLKYDKAVD
ncbi:hypothetical protein HOF78_02755 [Candidatus Woesearchaeota archaeon]|jgi:hypothetical protein|nr:hypothetical protein [Candidatus Woesearchaeota archaeon]MBT6044673.1 hypothetical protein [Candidatus Woesearchaeota archaeon]